jgi:zinc protease
MHLTRRSIARTAASLLLLAALAAPSAAADKPYQKLKTPKLRDVAMPGVTRVTLDNGMQLFVVEDRELPLMRMTLTMKVGSAYSPKDKLGLAEITAGVLRSGGSEVLPGDQMDELLENIGGSIESSAENLTTTLGVNVLVEDSERAMQLLRDLLLRPSYPQDKLDLELKQWKSGIARRNDDPGSVAEREFDKILYGAEHPFVAQVEYEHLDRIERADLIDFHRRYYAPNDAFLAVWGDFDAKAIIEKVRGTLGTWPRGNVVHPVIPAVPEMPASVNLATKESVNQSNILMGHRGTTMKDPDYYSLVVMNEILGGGFGSRLFNEVRSHQGLSYRVGSSLGAGMQYPGMFMVRCGTKSETTLKAAQACIAEVQKLKTQPITAEELQRAKEGILNSHVFNFTNKGSIVNRQIAYVRNGYPADFMEQFPKRIESVTQGDVGRVAGKYLQPDRFTVMVVGKPADFDASLAALGKVNEIDISIPEPKVKEDYPPATPETLAQGQDVMAAAVKAAGGLAALEKIDHVTEVADLTLSIQGQSLGGKLTRYVAEPGSLRQEINIMGQNMVQAYDGASDTGFAGGPQGVQDLDADKRAEMKSDRQRELLTFLRKAGDYNPQYLGQADVKGAPADVVLMRPAGGKPFKVFVDRKTRYVVKAEYAGRNPMMGTPVHEELFLEDFRKVGALVLPHRSIVVQDGEQFLRTETTSFSWAPIPMDKFRKSS